MSPPRLVFVCRENANRSQMAEAFARHYGGDRVDAHSAGSAPSGKVNPRAVAAMAERGIDLRAQRSKGLDDLPDGHWDAAVTMGCGDACPMLDASRRLDWDLEDPAHLDDRGLRRVRDEIGRRVLDLLHEVGVLEERAGEPLPAL